MISRGSEGGLRLFDSARARLAPLIARARAWPIDFVDVLLVLAAFFAVRTLLWRGLGTLDAFDEALLLLDAQLLNDGRVIYRDFYANYPPGIFQLVRPILAWGLPGPWTLRLIGLLVRLASAACAAWAVGRARGTRPCLATGTVVLMLQSRLGLTPYAYGLAVVLVFLVTSWWPRAVAPRWQAFASGAAFALMSYLRIDLFTYGCMLLVGAEAIQWIVRRRSLLFETPGNVRDFGTGLALTGVALWLPHVVAAGFSRLAHDLVLDVARLAMPARVLPMPSLFSAARVAAIDTTLPAWLVDRTRLCLVLGFASVAIGGYFVIRQMRQREAVSFRARTVVLLSLFAVCTLPQALGRTDYHHVAYGVPLVAAVLGSLLGRRVMRLLALLLLLSWLHERVHFISGAQAAQLLWDRSDQRFMAADRAPLVELIQAQTSPGDPIFVGCSSHRRHIVVPLDVYYWSRRPGATRYMQFDPGLTTSLEVHRQMIADLELNQPKLFVRFKHCLWDEPNASRNEGSPLLDEYLVANYFLSKQLPNFDVLVRRNSGQGSPAGLRPAPRSRTGPPEPSTEAAPPSKP